MIVGLVAVALIILLLASGPVERRLERDVHDEGWD